jgi:hypothetical protein
VLGEAANAYTSRQVHLGPVIPCILIPSSDEKMTTSPFELDPKLIRFVFESF